MSRTNAPSLVQLCIKTAVDNLSHIRDVGDTDIHLLKEILNKCTPDQLTQIENASKDRDLRSVTKALWHQFYIEKFGVESANQLGVVLNWRQIYEDKSKEWTIIVSTNATTLDRTATTPGCLKKSLDQIKKVCEALLDQLKLKLSGEIAFALLWVSIFIAVFGFTTYALVKAFIAAQYIKATIVLVFLGIMASSIIWILLQLNR